MSVHSLSEAKAKDRQAIKASGIRSYFILAAKEIISIEGVNHVSVRKVPKKAGYSYATIYNYFST
jgi:AcrR family transcriptional regulator